MPREQEDFVRTKRIREMREQGLSLRDIGKVFKISRQRVGQIVLKNECRRILDKRVAEGILTQEEREKCGESLSVRGV